MNAFFTKIKNFFFQAEAKTEKAINGVVSAKGLATCISDMQTEVGHGKDVIQKDLDQVMGKLRADYANARALVVALWGEDLVITLENNNLMDTVRAIAHGSTSDIHLGDSTIPIIPVGPTTRDYTPPLGSAQNPVPESFTPHVLDTAKAGVRAAATTVAAIQNTNHPVDAYEYDEISHTDATALEALFTQRAKDGWMKNGPLRPVWISETKVPNGGSWSKAYAIRRLRPASK